METRLKDVQPDWDFPDLAQHNPNCSSVADESIKKALVGHWPVGSDGVARIPYTFSPAHYWSNSVFLTSLSIYFRGLRIVGIPESYADLYKATVRAGLEKWSQMSNGTVQFYETSLWRYFSKGVVFILATPDSLAKFHSTAMTAPLIDNNGNINQAFVFYPAAPDFWNTTGQYYEDVADNIQAVTHEMGHVLGWLDVEPPARFNVIPPLQNTPDGAFCSVMPYDYFGGTVAECEMYCDPPHAIFPASLDERMLVIAYKQNYQTCWPGIDSWLLFARNTIFSALESIVISGFHAGIHSFMANLQLQPNKELLTKTTVNIIADSSMLAATFYLDIPIWATGSFVITMGTKYLPESILNKLPAKARQILTSNYSIYALNSAITLAKGTCVIPLAGSMLMSLLGSKCGMIAGECCGSVSGQITSYFLKTIYAKCATPEAVVPDVVPLQNAAHPPAGRPEDIILISNPEELSLNAGSQPEYGAIPVERNTSRFFYSGWSTMVARARNCLNFGRTEEGDLENQYARTVSRQAV